MWLLVGLSPIETRRNVRYVAKMSMTGYSKYDQLLAQARGSAKYWIPKLCEALRRESSEMSYGAQSRLCFMIYAYIHHSFIPSYTVE
jgi:hypothetical protein